MARARGFTLVELVAVIVVLSIVATIGSGFVVTAVDSYRDTQQRAKLVQKGRLAIEQMTRQLRLALPHSVRVSPSGNCIEFMPVAGGATYVGSVADAVNGMTPTSSVNTGPVQFSLGTPVYVAIGGLSEADIYNTGSPSALVGVGAIDATPPASVGFAGPHRFIRNSINQRLFLVDSPKRFCVAGSDLVQYAGYALDTSSLDDSAVGTQTTIVADVAVPTAQQVFVLSGGSEDRGTAIDINLEFLQGASAVTLNHQVLVRNVP